MFLDDFAAGLPRKQAEALHAVQRPLAFSAGNIQSGVPAYESKPSWYVLGTQDRIITPASQQFMAERANATLIKVKAGHLSLVSNPAAVTAVIEKAAPETPPGRTRTVVGRCP